MPKRSPKQATVKSLFEGRVSKNVKKDPAAARAVGAIYQFHVTGKDGGDWVLNLSGLEGGPGVKAGRHPAASCVITLERDDFLAIMSGGSNAVSAYMLGKLKVDGDINLALKLAPFLG